VFAYEKALHHSAVVDRQVPYSKYLRFDYDKVTVVFRGTNCTYRAVISNLRASVLELV